MPMALSNPRSPVDLKVFIMFSNWNRLYVSSCPLKYNELRRVIRGRVSLTYLWLPLAKSQRFPLNNWVPRSQLPQFCRLFSIHFPLLLLHILTNSTSKQPGFIIWQFHRSDPNLSRWAASFWGLQGRICEPLLCSQPVAQHPQLLHWLCFYCHICFLTPTHLLLPTRTL